MKSTFFVKSSLILAICVVSVAGCTPSDDHESTAAEALTPVSGTKAVLDYETHTIALPLDSVTMTDEMVREGYIDTIKRSNECMQKKGYSFYISVAQMEATTIHEDREFGNWDVESAAVYGLGLAPGPYPKDLLSPEPVFSDTKEEAAHLACMAEGPSPLWDIDLTPMDELKSTAYYNVDQDPRSEAVYEDYRACLTTSGYTPAEGRDTNVQEKLETPAQQIEAAVAMAECNLEQSTAQRLADITAEYQQAAINENEALVKEFKDKIAEALK